MVHYVLDTRTAAPHFPGIGRYVASLACTLPVVLGPDERLTLLVDSRYSLSVPDGHAADLALLRDSPFSVAQQWSVPKLLRRLYANVYHSPYLLMPYRPGVQSVLTVYDLIPVRIRLAVSASARLLFQVAMALALRTARRVLATSRSTRRDLIDSFGTAGECAQVVPLAADSAFCPQSAQASDALRSRLGLPERYLLYVGSNKPHKNLPCLIDAFALIVQQSPEWTIVVAGPWDPRYPDAQKRVEVLQLKDKVVFLGRVAERDLPPLYAGATLFAFPSLYEGFGLPVLEAMACGTPVVCSRRSSLPEVAADAAVYCDPAQPESIAHALQMVLGDADLRQDLRERGLVRASQFSWERTARETLAVYREIAQ